MAKASAVSASSGQVPLGQAKIFKATLASGGDVSKVAEITEPQAIIERQAGTDIVVCGNDLAANRDIAKRFEQTANGRYTRHAPHANAGFNALPHYQPDPRPPAGHCFYETSTRKAE